MSSFLTNTNTCSTAKTEFPTFTICADYYQAYKPNILKKYSVTPSDIRNHFFTKLKHGNTSTYEIFEEATHELIDIVKFFVIGVKNPMKSSGEYTVNIPLNEDLWKRQNYHALGRCYSLKLPIEILESEVIFARVTVNMQSLLYFHHAGQFFWVDSDNKVPLLMEETWYLNAVHQVGYSRPIETPEKSLSFTCSEEMNYGYDSCMARVIDEILMEKVQCKFPMIIGKPKGPNICDFGNFSDEQKIVYESLLKNDMDSKTYMQHTCNTPCATLETTYGIPDKQPYSKGNHHLKLYFKTNISVKKSIAAYDFRNFLAEIGGYMGMFLGVSLMDSYMILRRTYDSLYRRP